MDKHLFNFDDSYLRLPNELFTLAHPVSVSSPEIVVVNNKLADSLGVDLSQWRHHELAAVFSGNEIELGSTPFCQAYAGHQYAHFTMLGDGRAHVLGEHITPSGSRFDCQLKGSGCTPYSRRGDGRATLGPMLREYIISEAMFALGIPTTRSLAVVTTGDPVMRTEALPGAILTRIARAHIRVGTFQFAATHQNPKLIKALLDYTVGRLFPDIPLNGNLALAFLNRVVEQQADLISQWMRVGFIHGVMNTDNMSIAGETIDYGPCALMDEYDPVAVYSYIDQHGRYAYGQQPGIAQWNIARLAETLLPLIHDNRETAVGLATEVVNGFSSAYQQQWLSMMRSKLGLTTSEREDAALIADLLEWMQQHGVDYTNTFRCLTYGGYQDTGMYAQASFSQWLDRWQARLSRNGTAFEASQKVMAAVNPVVIARNHQVERVLSAACDGDSAPLHELLDVLSHPYDNSQSIEPFQRLPTADEKVVNTFCGT